MSNIHNTDDDFTFSNLKFSKPTSMPGGNYFIRCSLNSESLYIQSPKCTTKQGILKAGKKYYTDLMFTNENDNFIRWMENLEEYSQQYLYENRANLFESDMELHDIENCFTSPLKIFKSGKYYIVRVNIQTSLGLPLLKIYDENEQEVEYNSVNNKTTVISILEIKGIKCSATCFQIEIELKQMLTINPIDLFTKCIIKNPNERHIHNKNEEIKPTVTETLENTDENLEKKEEIIDKIGEPDNLEDNNESIMIENTPFEEEKIDLAIDDNTEINNDDIKINDDDIVEIESVDDSVEIDLEKTDDIGEPEIILSNEQPENDENKDELQEIEINLDELPTENINIKKRNDVYYEMYREARKKAKIARDLALSSYLEAKRIKNTYMLDDIQDSDESDLEMEET